MKAPGDPQRGTFSPLILASASPRRRELFARVGIDVEILPAAIVEVPRSGEKARAFAARMAAEKAIAVAEQAPGRWVIAADTVVAAGPSGEVILGKPADDADARAMLGQLFGSSHRVISAFCLISPDGARTSGAGEAEVVMRRASNDEIAGYVAAGEWRGKAGGYAIQGMAAAFVTEVRGSVTAVVGLPLSEVCVALAEAGCARPDFRRGIPA